MTDYLHPVPVIGGMLAYIGYSTLIKPLMPAPRPTLAGAAAAAAPTARAAPAESKGEVGAPGNSAAQRRATLAWQASSQVGVSGRCVVTGGSGLVGQRLVEMLIERGADSVVSFDIAPAPENAWQHPKIEYVQGDLCNYSTLVEAFAGADVVFHIAAMVGPYHARDTYMKVNYDGTLNVIKACKEQGVTRLVASTSPSTRFDGNDIDGSCEADLLPIPQASYQAMYAESKALGEIAVREACSDSLLTVAIAPHQVYGPRDKLFVLNFLKAAKDGMLRVFACKRTGYGNNRVSFTFVDNYCHGLMQGALKLKKGSPVLGQFYVVTDGDTHPSPQGYAPFWPVLDEMCMNVGFASLYDGRMKVPDWLLLPIGHICDAISWLTGRKLKLNAFAVRMTTIHRWFDISKAVKDLEYAPVVPFQEAWEDTAEWYKEHWLLPMQEGGGGNGNDKDE